MPVIIVPFSVRFSEDDIPANAAPLMGTFIRGKLLQSFKSPLLKPSTNAKLKTLANEDKKETRRKSKEQNFK